MAYTENLPKHQSLIWQDAEFQAVRVMPGWTGNLFYIDLQQRDRWINLSLDGAKALIKQLQEDIKNKEAIIKANKSRP